MEKPQVQPRMARFWAKCWAEEVQGTIRPWRLWSCSTFERQDRSTSKTFQESSKSSIIASSTLPRNIPPPGLALVREVHLDSALEKLFQVDEHDSDILYAGNEAVIGNPSATFSKAALVKEITEFCNEFETGYTLLSKPKESTEEEVESNRLWMNLLLTNVQLWELDHPRPGGNGCCTIL